MPSGSWSCPKRSRVVLPAGTRLFPSGGFRWFAVAPVAMPRLCRGLRLAAAILRQRAADVVALLDPALRVAPDVALVAARGDQFAFRGCFFCGPFFRCLLFHCQLRGEFAT